MSLPRTINSQTTLLESIEIFHDTTIIHPKFIHATLEIEVMCGGVESDNMFLEKCAQNHLLAGERVENFIYELDLRPNLLEIVFFDLLLLFQNNKKCIAENL